MMRFGITILLTALVVLAVFWGVTRVPAHLEDAPAGSHAVAVVDMHRVLQNSGIAKERLANLQQETDSLQRELDGRRTKLQAQLDQYEEEKDKLSDDERVLREQELKKTYTAYQDDLKRTQEQLGQKKRAIEAACREDIGSEIRRFAEDNHYRLVLEVKEDERAGVLYWDESAVDITSDIIERVNG